MNRCLFLREDVLLLELEVVEIIMVLDGFLCLCKLQLTCEDLEVNVDIPFERR